MAAGYDGKYRAGAVAHRHRRARGTALVLVASTTLVLLGCRGGSPASLSSSGPDRARGGVAADPGPVATPPDSAPAATSPTTALPLTTSTTTTPRVTVPSTAAPTVAGPAGLRTGNSGPAVVQMQQSLSALGYWLGTVDGNFQLTTGQAVIALQKAAGLPRTGIFDSATAAALAAGVKPRPQSSSGHVIEVDLAHQLILIVTNGHVDAILHTSTGGGYKYTSQGTTSVAITPVGHFTTNWQVDGTRVSPLGVLWRPKFFVGGIAIHGDSSVPTRPVSHGCVRVSNEAINWIWATNADPIGTPVWVY